MKILLAILFTLLSPAVILAKEPIISSEDFYDLDYTPTLTSKINIYDPFEKFNREIHDFNVFFLTYFAKPFYNNIYSKITNVQIRKAVHNVFMNLKRPMIFFNYLAQLDIENASKTLYSFIMDTLYGIGGLRNVSGHQNVSAPTTTLGITLGKYGVSSGPYLVLPFLGPNSVRDSISMVTEMLINPIEFNVLKIGGKKDLINDWVIYTKITLYTLDQMNVVVLNFYDLMESSFDSYILMRDAYYQSQEFQIERKRGD